MNDTVARNDAEKDRLRELLARLTDEDLARSLGGGWTVSAALAHMAFWDRRAFLLLEEAQKGRFRPQGEEEWYADELTNNVLLAEWLSLPPRTCVSLALVAAEEIDDYVFEVDDAMAAKLEERGDGYLLTRYNHRQEHIDQIEAALKGS